MSQADPENSRPLPKRRLGSFHFIRDHRWRRSSFRMRQEFPHFLRRPGDAMTGVSFCHTRCSRRMGLGGCRDRPRKLKKSPHLMRSSAGQPGASRVITLRGLYHDHSAPLRCQLLSYEKAHSKRAARKPPPITSAAF